MEHLKHIIYLLIQTVYLRHFIMSRNGILNVISTVCSPFERFTIKNCHGVFFFSLDFLFYVEVNFFLLKMLYVNLCFGR